MRLGNEVIKWKRAWQKTEKWTSGKKSRERKTNPLTENYKKKAGLTLKSRKSENPCGRQLVHLKMGR